MWTWCPTPEGISLTWELQSMSEQWPLAHRFEETERGSQTGGDCSFIMKASEVGTVRMMTAEKPGAAGFQTLASISLASVLCEHLLCA